jgi:glycosyltransferase involved in cell wall biosynthesis
MRKLNILWKGPVFNNTGIATAAREIVKRLAKNHNVRCTDIWNSDFKGLEFLNQPIDKKTIDWTLFYDYPDSFRREGKTIGHFIHEGTKLYPAWIPKLNSFDKLFVASKANERMFRWCGVNLPMEIINYGFDEVYKPSDEKLMDTFLFLSVNSWTGNKGDRKGTDLLIQAFNEEFKPEEDVRLLLKISTPWASYDEKYYMANIINLCGGKVNENILLSTKWQSEEDMAKAYQKSHCFVCPTRGEGFGLTPLNSLACGCPVIITKDRNSGHMDFCKDNPGVLWIDAPEVKQGDRTFFIEGNYLAEPSLESLKKQMRWAFEHRDELKEMGKRGADFVKDMTWDKTANKIVEMME